MELEVVGPSRGPAHLGRGEAKEGRCTVVALKLRSFSSLTVNYTELLTEKSNLIQMLLWRK